MAPNIVGQAGQIIAAVTPLIDALTPFLPPQVAAVVEVAKLAVRAGENVAPYVAKITHLAGGGTLSASESAELRADRKRLSGTLQEPLPPEEE